MKTGDFIDLLANTGTPVAPGAVARRYGIALALGLVFGALAMQLEFGLNPDIEAYAAMPMFWVKVIFSALVVVAGFYAVTRLARPGADVRRLPATVTTPFVVLWMIAVAVLATAEPGEAEQLVFGNTWRTCALNIAMLSGPAFAATLWAMKGLAPTRPVIAGAAAGLFAGGIGSLVYTVHCPELMPPFIGIWYVAGMLIPAALGALLGPRLLRW